MFPVVLAEEPFSWKGHCVFSNHRYVGKTMNLSINETCHLGHSVAAVLLIAWFISMQDADYVCEEQKSEE